MKKLITIVVCVLTLSFASMATASVIDFDDINTGAQGWADLPLSYSGYEWQEFEVMSDWFYTSTYGNTTGAPSSPNAVYNGDGVLNATISNPDSDFNFIGGFFSAWSRNENQYLDPSSSHFIALTGYDDGILVDSITLNLSPSYQWFDINFLGIDELIITSSGDGKYWLMDDFTAEPVPEPATVLLLSSGLIGLAAVSRKKFRR